MIGYETINVCQPDLTEEEKTAIHSKNFEQAKQMLREHAGKSEEERRLIWRILTSRGDEKLMFGPMPDVCNQTA